MITATLTSKGQLTIPKTVREALNLHTGDRIAFAVHDNNEVVLKPLTKSVDQVYGMLHNPKQLPKSVEQMKTAVAIRMRKRRL